MKAVLLTEEYTQSDRARAVPGAVYNPGGGADPRGWYLPSDADDHSARIALRLFPHLIRDEAIVERAAVQNVRPIDKATPAWGAGRPTELDPWQRVLGAARAEGIEPHLYQRIDADYAMARLQDTGGAYVGHEPGLGKSLLSCMIIDAWNCNYVLVVCPNSAKLTTWLPTLRQYVPWMEPVVIGNTAKQRRAAFTYACARTKASQPTVVVCHYEALALIAKEPGGWAKLGAWDLVVADEAHRLKNRKTGFVRVLQKMEAVGKLLMSGSVLDGDFEDLFVPWKMMNPTRYRAMWRDWNDRFGDYVQGSYGMLSLGVKPHRLPAFRDELGELLVVRRASDELDIPAPHVTRLSVPMLPAQVAVYEQLREDLLAELPDGELVATTVGAGLIQALRVVTGGVPTEDGGYESAKLDALCGLLEDIGRQQVVVFGWHRELVERAASRLQGAAFVHGGVSNAQREKIVAKFRAGQTQILCATMGTLSESVNLQNAGRVVLLEHSWRPLDNDQAINRVVRQGQSVHAAVDHITCADTVDELRVLPVTLSKTLLRQLLIGR